MKKYIKATDPSLLFFSLLFLIFAIISYITSIAKDFRELIILTIFGVIAAIVCILGFVKLVNKNKTNNDIIRKKLKDLKFLGLPCKLEIFDEDFYDVIQKTDNIYLFICSSEMYILGSDGCFKIDSKLKNQIIENITDLSFSLEKIYRDYTKNNIPEVNINVVYFEDNKGLAKLTNAYILYRSESKISFRITNEEAEDIINGKANINDIYTHYLKLEALKKELI